MCRFNVLERIIRHFSADWNPVSMQQHWSQEQARNDEIPVNACRNNSVELHAIKPMKRRFNG